MPSFVSQGISWKQNPLEMDPMKMLIRELLIRVWADLKMVGHVRLFTAGSYP